MKNAVLAPYLNFNGNCREAMEFYQSVLGGELSVTTFGEANPGSAEGQQGRLMHADLQNDTLSFMASDTLEGMKFIEGNNIHLSLAGADEELLRKFFDGLSAGGYIDMPLDKQSWGDLFGMFTDKFGIHWMINIGGNAE